MLEIKFIRQNLPQVQKAIENRGDHIDWSRLVGADENRKHVLQEIETLRHKRNVVSDQIAEMKKKGESAEDTVTEMRKVSGRIKQLETSLSENEDIIRTILMQIPNIPHESVPVGQDHGVHDLLFLHPDEKNPLFVRDLIVPLGNLNHPGHRNGVSDHRGLRHRGPHRHRSRPRSHHRSAVACPG